MRNPVRISAYNTPASPLLQHPYLPKSAQGKEEKNF